MPVLYSGCGQQVYLPEKECDECDQFEARLTRVEDELPNKQDQLSTGYGIDMSSNTISADLTEIQEKLVAGDGIRIIDDVISVMNLNGDPHFWSESGVVYITELDKDSYLNTGDGLAIVIDNTSLSVLYNSTEVMRVDQQGNVECNDSKMTPVDVTNQFTVTSTQSGATCTVIKAVRCGNVMTVIFVYNNTAQVTPGNNIFTGTIDNPDFYPVNDTAGCGFISSSGCITEIIHTGLVKARVIGANVAANSNAYNYFTYLIA